MVIDEDRSTLEFVKESDEWLASGIEVEEGAESKTDAVGPLAWRGALPPSRPSLECRVGAQPPARAPFCLSCTQS